MKKETMKKIVVALVAIGSLSLSGRAEPERLKIGGKGRLSFVNVAGVDGALLQKAVDKISDVLMIDAVVQDGKWNLPEAKKCLADTKATAAVFIVKDEVLPISIVAMEERWGVVNASRIPAKAITREAVRVACVVLGGAFSRYKTSALYPAFSGDELAQGGDSVTIDTLMAIYPNLEAVGFAQYQLLDYATALSVGRAPEPVNDEQRRLKEEFDRKRAKLRAEAEKSRKK